MAFLKRFPVCCLLFPTLLGAALIHVAGTYDLDGDGLSEILLLEQNRFQPGTLHYLEIDSSGEHHPIWTFSAPSEPLTVISDARLIDLNADQVRELVVSVSVPVSDPSGESPWLYVFPWKGTTFAPTPLKLSNAGAGKDRFRPLNLATYADSGGALLAVSMSSPARRAALVKLDFSPSTLGVESLDWLQPELIRSGFGPLYCATFDHHGDPHLAMVSPEGNLLKTSVYILGSEPREVASDLLALEGARGLFAPDILTVDLDHDGSQEVLLPFENGAVLALSYGEGKLRLTPWALGDERLFALPAELSGAAINQALLARVEAGLYEGPLLAPPEELPFQEETLAVAFTDTLSLGDTLVYQATPDSAGGFYSFQWLRTPVEGILFRPISGRIVWIPTRQDLGTHWLSYTYETRQGEKVVQSQDKVGDRHQLVPLLQSAEMSFAVVVRDTLVPRKEPLPPPPPKIHRIKVVSIGSGEDSGFIFEGVPSFNLTTGILPDQNASRHTISTDLALSTRDKQARFSYVSPEPQTDGLTTLKIQHDLETNRLITTLIPSADSLPQSFHPEDWDPDLYAFPEYFFEGFSADLSMDSSGRSIVFTLAEEGTGNQTIELTSPTKPVHHLKLFLTGGSFQATRGSVRVAEDGSQQTVTEVDFVGPAIPYRITATLEGAEASLPVVEVEKAPLKTLPEAPITGAEAAATATPEVKIPAVPDTLVAPLPADTLEKTLPLVEPSAPVSLPADTVESQRSAAPPADTLEKTPPLVEPSAPVSLPADTVESQRSAAPPADTLEKTLPLVEPSAPVSLPAAPPPGDARIVDPAGSPPPDTLEIILPPPTGVPAEPDSL